MAAVSGKLAKVRFGAGPTTFKSKKWTATYKAQLPDTTSSEDAGAGTYVGGVVDMDFAIEGDYDVGSAPLAAWVPGAATATVKLYINDTSGPFWLITTALIESVEVGAEVRGLVSIKITGRSSGGVTPPAT